MLNKLFKRRDVVTEQVYSIECRVSIPLSDGSYKETDIIKMKVHATDQASAKEKMKDYVMSKVKIALISIR